MPHVTEPLPAVPVSAPNRIRWTRAQCEAMQEAGILRGRYELIDGEILSKMGRKPPHAFVVQVVTAWLTHVFGIEFVRVQSTIDISETSPEYDEPEPDVALTGAPNTAYVNHHPTPAGLQLVVEVSDSTLRFDRTTKAALFALAGIREYWVIDLAGRQIFAHRQPTTEGYAEITVSLEDERIAPLARPEAEVRVADLLPPPT